MMKTVLDHVAIGTRTLSDGWDLFGGLLGGSWLYGGDSPGFWWGQLQFTAGPKIELLTPSADPDHDFLERFLASRGAGPHHLNFMVADINQTLSRIRALGIEPVGVSVLSANWKEAFLHPKDAFGIVVQVAQSSGGPPELAAPARLPAPGHPAAFSLVEHQVADLDAAIRLFSGALEGEVVRREQGPPESADLTWDNGALLRLVQATPAAGATAPRHGGGIGCLRFARDGSHFSAAERDSAAGLARRLGISLQLGQ
jgi:methylmalonyl-CoA/ethylmalonyl-CoA epimerase